MWQDDSLPEGVAARLWEDPDRLINWALTSSQHVLKEGDRCTVARIVVEGKSVVLKRYNAKDRFHTVVHWLLRSRARWSFLNGALLLEAGVATPAPLACVEDRKWGVLRERSFLLTEFVEGQSLLKLVDSGKAAPQDLRDFAVQFSAIWQKLGQMRIGHGDMKATNFMVDANKKLWLIDLDGMRVYRTGALLRRERRNDLARFMRNWREKPEVAATFRARIGTG